MASPGSQAGAILGSSAERYKISCDPQTLSETEIMAGLLQTRGRQ